MVESLERVREIEHMIAFQAPFDEIIAKIDECLAQPESETYRVSLAHFRVSAYVMNGRPVDECADVIDVLLAVQPEVTYRAQAVLAACGQRPELAPRYLDNIIAELEQAAPADPMAENTLQGAYRLRQRLRGERPKVIADRTLTVEGQPGSIVAVTIYEPQPDRAAGDGWVCEFRLSGAVDTQEHGNGLDSLSALENAIQGVRKYLDDSGLSLTWAGGEPGDHGVPRVVPQFFGRAFAREIEDDIDRRLAAHKPPGAP